MIRIIFALFVAWLEVPIPSSGQELCRHDFCGGISARTLAGTCLDDFSICDDQDDTTTDVCDGFRCQHTTENGGPVCFAEDCTPDCQGKECGEDDCGGFCGACGEGQGCSDFVCVSGATDGSCEAPLHLGENRTEMFVVTGDRVTVISTGDTSTSIHKLTPSCNTLTASPELIFTFQIPEGQTYGYDMRSYGYDTVLQLMKVW